MGGLRVNRLCAVLFASLVVLAVPCCGGNSSRDSVFQPSPSPVDLGSITLEQSLAELDALPIPEGADPQVFTSLKQAMREMLTGSGTERWVSTPPTGLANQVTVLTNGSTAEEEMGIQWSYLNTGDYNLDSLVNVSDITPIGVHYNKSTASPDWEESAQFADGNRDGMITVADITPIGQNYLNRCAAWRISGSDSEDGPFAELEDIAWDNAELYGNAELPIYIVKPATEYEYYRVTPLDGDGNPGQESVTSVPVILKEGVVVLNLPDTPEFVDRIEYGVYELLLPDSEPTDIEIGDILLASNRAGILIRVESMEQDGTQLIVNASRPRLDEAVLQGAFEYSTDDEPEPESKSVSVVLPEITLDGAEITDEDGLTVSILDGTLDFSPHYNFKANVSEHKQLDFFLCRVSGSYMELDMTVSVTTDGPHGSFPGEGQTQEDYEVLLTTMPFKVEATFGKLAVGASLKYTILFGASCTGNIDGTVTARYESRFDQFSCGSTYENGVWSHETGGERRFDEVTNPYIDTDESFELTAYVKPKFDMTLY